MAFTFCTNCGNKIEDGVEKCPYCGHIKGSERSYIYTQAETKPSPMPQTENQENNDQPKDPQTEPYGNPYADDQKNPNPYGGNGQSQNPYGNPYGGSRQSPYGNPYVGNGQNNGSPNRNNGQYPYGMPSPGGFYRPVQDRPVSVGLLIFSIINIIFGCCCSVGFVFGIIALVYTLNARQAPNDAEEIRRKKIALIFNIAAVVMTIALVVSFVVAVTLGAMA